MRVRSITLRASFLFPFEMPVTLTLIVLGDTNKKHHIEPLVFVFA